MDEQIRLPEWNPDEVPNENVAPQGHYQLSFESFEVLRTKPEKGSKLMVCCHFKGTQNPPENGVARGKQYRNYYVVANNDAPNVIDHTAMGTVGLKKLIRCCNAVPTQNPEADLQNAIGQQVVVYLKVKDDPEYGRRNEMTDTIYKLNDPKRPDIGPDDKSLTSVDDTVEMETAPPPGRKEEPESNHATNGLFESSTKTETVECWPNTPVPKYREDGTPNTQGLQDYYQSQGA